MKLPGITHAELLRRLQREIDRAGSKASAARAWGISPQLIGFIISGQRNVGPKLLKVLNLRRTTLVVHRYEPRAANHPRHRVIRKPARLTDRVEPE